MFVSFCRWAQVGRLVPPVFCCCENDEKGEPARVTQAVQNLLPMPCRLATPLLGNGGQESNLPLSGFTEFVCLGRWARARLFVVLSSFSRSAGSMRRCVRVTRADIFECSAVELPGRGKQRQCPGRDSNPQPLPSRVCMLLPLGTHRRIEPADLHFLHDTISSGSSHARASRTSDVFSAPILNSRRSGKDSNLQAHP